MTTLRAGDLIRREGLGASDCVDTYHDRIRETLVAGPALLAALLIRRRRAAGDGA